MSGRECRSGAAAPEHVTIGAGPRAARLSKWGAHPPNECGHVCICIRQHPIAFLFVLASPVPLRHEETLLNLSLIFGGDCDSARSHRSIALKVEQEEEEEEDDGSSSRKLAPIAVDNPARGINFCMHVDAASMVRS